MGSLCLSGKEKIMALLTLQYYSAALCRPTRVQLLLPNDVPEMMTQNNEHYKRPAKTLVLLHGYSGSCDDWLVGSRVQEISGMYNLAIVMPGGENSFYLNQKGTGRAYATFVGEELITYLRRTFGIAKCAEDTFVGGLSMGGFGALHTGLLYPENYSKIAALSSALIIHEVMGMKEGSNNGVADYDYYKATFGEPKELEKSENNPEYIIKQRKERGEIIQPVYMACGTEDFLLENNRNFHDFLKKAAVEVCYHESPGIHDWKFWNEYLEPAIKWLLQGDE